MRYRDVLGHLEALQATVEACSREWRITEFLMLHLEIDVFAAVQGMVTLPAHSERRGPARYLRVSLFWRSGERRDFASLSGEEMAATAEQLRVVDDWVHGKIAELPPNIPWD